MEGDRASSDTGYEKTGSIEMLDTSHRKVLYEIELFGIGPETFSMQKSEANKGETKTCKFEAYVSKFKPMANLAFSPLARAFFKFGRIVLKPDIFAKATMHSSCFALVNSVVMTSPWHASSSFVSSRTRSTFIFPPSCIWLN